MKSQEIRKEVNLVEDVTRIVETIHGQPYYSNKQLAKAFSVSKGTVCRRKKGIEKERKRYGNYAIISSGTNLYAYIDYDKYYKDLEDPIMRKHVPDYDPMQVAEACGYGKRVRMLK